MPSARYLVLAPSPLTPVALIRELDEEAKAQGKYTCVRCLAVAHDLHLCADCQVELDEDEPQEEGRPLPKRRCPGCGAELAEGEELCEACGRGCS